MAASNSTPVIFLAFANDRDDSVGGYLRNLSQEARRLTEVLQSAEQAGLCEVVVKQNSTAGDIFKVFQDPRYRNRIAIFHYGGHADGYQLFLETPEGKAATADAGGMAAFFAQQQRGIRLVVLNGCSTQQQTEALLNANISTVISTSRSIDDTVATDFAFQFYQGLSGGATIRKAYNEAAASMRTTKGGDMRSLYIDGKKGDSDRWPWDLYTHEGSNNAEQWSLPLAVNNPLFGLPPLPENDLPESPYRHLNWFTREDAEIFFGRGHQVRELYQRLTAGEQPVILFYGQSGVGKSSLLDAGLLPRLEQDNEVRYVRRGSGGLLATLRSQLVSDDDGLPIETSWLAIEKRIGKPLYLFLDQVEELFTRPTRDVPDELDDFLRTAKMIFSDSASRPEGKLVLGFRKEWLAELETKLVDFGLPRSKVFLEPLDRAGIIEVVEGPSRTKRLRERYGLEVENGLAEIIADDLLEDRDSAIAPTLQILLTKMWTKATEVNYEHPRFSRDLYQQLKRDGILLRDFLDQQIEKFREDFSDAVDSGLLLDLIALHTTPLGTANQCTVEQLRGHYAHLGTRLEDLLRRCQDLYLLTIATGTQKERSKATRLAHDTLAPLVRARFEESDKPGQRARRILDNRSVDWNDDSMGTPLDDADLIIVEKGVAGTRAWNATEQRLIEASRELRNRLQRTRLIVRVTGTVAVAMIAALAGFGWWSFNRSEIARRNLDDSNTQLLKKTKETELALTKAEQAKATGSQILGVIKSKSKTDVVIHGVLMEAFKITIDELELEKSKGTKDENLDRELAELRIAYAWHQNDHGESDLAIASYSRSLELLTELSQANPSDSEVALRSAFVMNNIGWCFDTKGDTNNALKQQEKTLRFRQQLLEQFPDEFEAKRQVAVSLGNLGNHYRDVGRTKEGIEMSLRGMAINEELWKEHPNNRWVGLNLSSDLANLSKAYLAQQNVETAIAFRTRAYDLRSQLYEDAKAGKPSEDGLGFFNFEDKYGKIAFELAELLIAVDPKNEMIETYSTTAVEILSGLHQKNQKNDEYRALYSTALEARTRYLISIGKSNDALATIQLSHSVAVGEVEVEKQSLLKSTHAFLRYQQLASTSLLAYCSIASDDPSQACEYVLEAAELYCRNILIDGEESDGVPKDLEKAIELLGIKIKDSPKVISFLADKSGSVPDKTFQQLKSLFAK